MKTVDYTELKHLINTSFVTDSSQMLDKLGLKTLRRDLKMVYKTVAKRRVDPGSFKASEIFSLAEFIEIEPAVVFGLVQKSMEKKKKK